MGELLPGPLVEDLGGGQDGVEVHDMDAATGERLKTCLIRGQRRSWPRATSPPLRPVHRSGAVAMPADHLRDGVRDVAAIDDGERADGDRLFVSRLSTRWPPASAAASPATDAPTARARWSGADQRQRVGHAARPARERCRRRCAPTPRSTPPRPGVAPPARSPWPARASRAPAVRGRRPARRAPPRAAARRPARDRA